MSEEQIGPKNLEEWKFARLLVVFGDGEIYSIDDFKIRRGFQYARADREKLIEWLKELPRKS